MIEIVNRIFPDDNFYAFKFCPNKNQKEKFAFENTELKRINIQAT